MIKIDEIRVEMDGDISKITSETATLMHQVCKRAENEAGIPYDEALNVMLEIQRMYILVDSGMSYQEAIDVVGLTKVRIKENEDGKFREIKISKQ